MPIGKNAIKRITNNGYSSVTTSAPDMENSVVNEEKSVVNEKKTSPNQSKNDAAKAASAQKPSAQRPSAQKPSAPKARTLKTQKKAPTAKVPPSPKKSMETERELAPIKILEKVVDTPEREGDGYINLGGKLPYYLL